MNPNPHEPSPCPKVKPSHRDRAAIVYVRQSTPQQVLDHQESTARQYALTGRAVALGWARCRVRVIDEDLGKSGQSIEGRPGYQRLLAEVALDRVGLILGLEMSRLARSCRDWHQLLELCARFRVLLADADGVYDPTEYSDRLLLGLTGMMNEAELHVLHQRMNQGKLNKARRGELVIGVPAGYVKLADGRVELDPDEQARGVIELIFDQFDRQTTVHGVLRYLSANGVRLPVRRQGGPGRGQLDWRAPCRETIRHILRHPMYAGAYRYGFRPVDGRRRTPGHPTSGRGSGNAPEDCLVFLRDRFPAYISWERFEANQARLAANRSRAEAPGVARGGAALLAGVVWCGRCGKRMYVRYAGSAGSSSPRATYVCSTLRSDYGLPLCQSVSAAGVERWVAEQIHQALRPAALEASLNAVAEIRSRREQARRHWEQRIERTRYEAERAARQYHACEPENRLVARTLERLWDEALQALGRIEAEFERFERDQPRPLSEADRDQIRRLAEEVPALWEAPSTTPADRQRIARLLLERVVLTIDGGDDRVAVRAEWAGGEVRGGTIRRAVRGYEDQAEWPRMAARLEALHGTGRTPARIAEALDREGFRPPKRANGFTASMVRRLLHELGLRVRVSRRASSGEALGAGERWLNELAAELGVSPHTLHGWRRKGWVNARQVGGRGGPWAVWANETELARLKELRSCPRLWTNRERLVELRRPTPRPD